MAKTKTKDKKASSDQRLRIRKVKFVTGKTLIDYEVLSKYNDTMWDKHSLVSADEPLPEMKIALKSLAPFVCEICELPKEWDANVVVYAASLSYHGEDSIFSGAIISARKIPTNGGSPFGFNTPHRPTTSKNPDAMLPPEAVNLLNEVCDHAEDFIKGKRQQQDLFPSEEEAAEDLFANQ
jgi:hypothetical protein